MAKNEPLTSEDDDFKKAAEGLRAAAEEKAAGEAQKQSERPTTGRNMYKPEVPDVVVRQRVSNVRFHTAVTFVGSTLTGVSTQHNPKFTMVLLSNDLIKVKHADFIKRACFVPLANVSFFEVEE